MDELTVEARLDNLEAVTSFINQKLENVGCSAKTIMQIDLAVEEIYVNIARYAYDQKAGEATVCCTVAGEPLSVTIWFSDSGAPFNPLTQAAAPDITKSVDERPTGGLGVFLVKKLMDEVSYEFKQGKNVLTIRKTL